MNKPTHIYALHDPRDWSIRYVGKANDPERRHRKPRSHNLALQRFISELRALGLKPRVSILQTCSAGQWQNWEKFWIATCKAAGEKLLNLHPGGDGPVEPRPWNKGLKMSDEQRARMVFPKNTPDGCRAARLGKKDSEETKRKKSLAAKGRVFSSEHLAKLSAWQRGKKKPVEQIEKMRLAKVGTKLSLERIAKYKATMAPIIKSSEYRGKMAAAFRGRKRDPISKKWLPVAAPQEV